MNTVAEKDQKVKTPKYYTVQETAELLRVSERTIYRQIKEGLLPAIQMKKFGFYRISQSTIEKLNEKNE